MGLKHRRDLHAEPREQFRNRVVATAKDAVFAVSITVEHQHRDGRVERVDDPVFGEARFGVVKGFFLSITRRSVGADNLDDEICAEPILVLIARVVGVTH